MNRTIYTLFFFFILTLCAHTQEAILVSDYNPGAEDGFSEWFHENITHEDNIYIAIGNPDTGTELGVINGGTVSLLADINPGMGSSKPRGFIKYKGKIYFRADVNDSESALFETDGTTQGTVQAYDPGYLASIFEDPIYLESKSGWLYFRYNLELHRFDGTNFENLGPAGFFETSITNPLIDQYGEEVIFGEESFGDVTIKSVASDGTFNTLLDFDAGSGSGLEALFVLGDWIFYSISNSFNEEASGLFAYKEGNAMAEKVLDNAPSRFLQINDETVIGPLFREGIMSIVASGDEITTEMIIAGDPVVFTQTTPMPAIVHKGKALYLGMDDFIDEIVLVTDASTYETESTITLKPYNSNMILHNNYGMIAGGTANFFEPTIHYYNFKTCEFGVIKEFIESSLNGPSIILAGVQDSKLYFMSNLDPDVGRELYYIEISNLVDLNLSVDDSEESLEVDFSDRGFKLKTLGHETFRYRISDLSGRTLRLANGTSNTQVFYDLDYSGLINLVIETEGGSFSALRYVNAK